MRRFRDDPLVLLLGTSLHVLNTLALGLTISTVCKTQQHAFATTFVFSSSHEDNDC